MKTLSEFLEIPEGVEFKFTNATQAVLIESTFKVSDNTLYIKGNGGDYIEAYININELIKLNIKELPKQILTDEEKAYLKAVIKPVKDKVVDMYRTQTLYSHEHVFIHLKNSENMTTYPFEPNTRFKGMKINQEYTLKELGLEEENNAD